MPTQPKAQYSEDTHPHRRLWKEKFEQFHKDNPEIYEKLREHAIFVRNRGLKCSIYFLIERVRWFFMFETAGEQSRDFKINNNFSPFYAANSWRKTLNWPACLKSGIMQFTTDSLRLVRGASKNDASQQSC